MQDPNDDDIRGCRMVLVGSRDIQEQWAFEGETLGLPKEDEITNDEISHRQPTSTASFILFGYSLT